MDRSISRRSRRLSIALPVDRCMSREHVSRKSVRWMSDLFYEDADWSIRTKPNGWRYARDSIVPHRGGTTIGSARLRAERSPGSQCISKAEIISTSFACIGTGICPLRSCWDAWA
jgi:hypothetical protein